MPCVEKKVTLGCKAVYCCCCDFCCDRRCCCCRCRKVFGVAVAKVVGIVVVDAGVVQW